MGCPALLCSAAERRGDGALLRPSGMPQPLAHPGGTEVPGDREVPGGTEVVAGPLPLQGVGR